VPGASIEEVIVLRCYRRGRVDIAAGSRLHSAASPVAGFMLLAGSPTHQHSEVSRVANIDSQIKRNRQAVVRHERNKAVRSTLKTHLKKFRTAAEAGDATAAGDAYRAAAKKLDKAAQRGVIHANYAANKKSKMAKKLQSLSA
jgi:small subunit ribosomal protein S20